MVGVMNEKFSGGADAQKTVGTGETHSRSKK
jgi:hypothetical protein